MPLRLSRLFHPAVFSARPQSRRPRSADTFATDTRAARSRRLARAASFAVEYMEKRVLLTTVTTNGATTTFDYQGITQAAPGAPAVAVQYRVTQGGNTSAEYVAGITDENNNPILTNLPIDNNGVQVDGGYGGAYGSTNFGNINILDPISSYIDGLPGSGHSQDDVTSGIGIDAIAADPAADPTTGATGVSYGFDVTTITQTIAGQATTRPVIQLIEFQDTISFRSALPVTLKGTSAVNTGGNHGVAIVLADLYPTIRDFQNIPSTSLNPAQPLRLGTLDGDAAGTPISGTVELEETPPTTTTSGVASPPVLPITGVTAADFDPITENLPAASTVGAGGASNRLYFVLRGGSSNRPQLFSIDVHAGDAYAPVLTVAGGATGSVGDPVSRERAIRESLIAYTGTFGATPVATGGVGTTVAETVAVNIPAMVFDQTSNQPGAQAATLDVFGNITNSIFGAGGSLWQVNQTNVAGTINGAPVQYVQFATNAGFVPTRHQNTVTMAGVGDVNSITGLAFDSQYATGALTTVTGAGLHGDDPNAADTYVFAVTGGGAAGTAAVVGTGTNTLTQPSLIRITLNTRRAMLWGTLSIPGSGTPAIGADIEDLTFAPNLIDPLSPATSPVTGTLLGVDPTSNNLVIISAVLRPPEAYLYNITVSASDDSGTSGTIPSFITVAEVTGDPAVTDPTKALTSTTNPFGGESGGLTIHTDNGTPDIDITAPGGSGSAYLGMKQDTGEKPRDRLIPVLSAPLLGTLGTLPATDTLSAGFTVNAGLNFGGFLFAGTVTGAISLGGSIDTLYAGWLITGDAGGLAGGGLDDLGTGTGLPGGAINPASVTAAGDIRNIWVQSDAGTETGQPYNTGFAMTAAGRIGQFRTIGTYRGNALATSDSSITHKTTNFSELEDKTPLVDGDDFANPTYSSNSAQYQFDLGRNAAAANDSFASAQYVGTLSTNTPSATIDGSLQETFGDEVDYYAMGVLAGQTVTVSYPGQEISVAVIDPDGRVVATDYSNISPGTRGVAAAFGTTQLTQTYQFTADRPGAYRFLVTLPGNTAPLGGPTTVVATGLFPYTLTIGTAGDVSFGAIYAGNIVGAATAGGFEIGNQEGNQEAANGDLGVLRADALIDATAAIVPGGNLRDAEAANIGAPLTNGLLLDVTGGSVGLLRATGAILHSEADWAVDPITDLFVPDTNAITGLKQIPVGLDYQVIDVPNGELAGSFIANRNIGTIRADTFSSTTEINLFEPIPAAAITSIAPSVIQLNPTSSPDFQSRIDLIDVTGDLGSPSFGGPAIGTGPGGDVRYMRVGATAYADNFFHSGGSTTGVDTIVHNPGVPVTITDDSGSEVTITPTGVVSANPNYDPNLISPLNFPSFGPAIAVRTYPIRGSGGNVILNVTVEEIGQQGTATGTAGGTAATPTTAAVLGTTEVDPGLTITGTSTGNNGAVEIGRLQIMGNTGLPITLSPVSDINGYSGLVVGATTTTTTGSTSTATTTGDATPPPMSINITSDGHTAVDVLSVFVTGTSSPLDQYTGDPSNLVNVVLPTNLTDAGNIVNSTGGEIVNLAANSVQTLASTGTLGIAKSSTPAAVIGIANIQTGTAVFGRYADQPGTAATDIGGAPGNPAGNFPFDLQKNAIYVAGNAINIAADEGIGAVVVGGQLQSYNPNADGRQHAGFFAGINGPLDVSQAIISANIGQGMPSAGTGDFAATGIFAARIDNVVGNGADIRGPIIGIDTITNLTLTNGSLIHATIVVPDQFETTFVTEVGGVITGVTDTTSPIGYNNGLQWGLPADFETIRVIENPRLSIRNLTISGNGGILGSLIEADNITTFNAGGFGIVGSVVNSFGTLTVGTINAGGFGIRASNLYTGAAIGVINVYGNGSQLSTNALDPGVLQSRSSPSDAASSDPIFGGPIDPYFGTAPNALIDLDAFLGTSAQAPDIAGVTDTGVFEDSHAEGLLALGSFAAQTVRTSLPELTYDNNSGHEILNAPVPNQQFPTDFSFGQTIKKFIVRGTIDGLTLETAHIGTIGLGNSISRFGLTVAGIIDGLLIHGNFGQSVQLPDYNNPGSFITTPDSYIRTTGSSGYIRSLGIIGDLVGNVSSAGKIGTIVVTGNVVGGISIEGLTSQAYSLDKLVVEGSLKNGSLTVSGSVNSIVAYGSIGAPGDTLHITGNLNSLVVGANRKAGPASLNLALTVDGNARTIVVYGDVLAPIVVGGTLGTLVAVGTAGATADLITQPISAGSANLIEVINGNLGANVTVSNNLKGLAVLNGNVDANVTIASTIGSIGAVYLKGSLLGSVNAPSGRNGSVYVTGTLGDGTNPVTITAFDLGSLRVNGVINAGATVTVTDQLGVFIAGSDVNSTVTAARHKKTLVVGQVNGVVNLGPVG